ncbi:M14 family metallopeptidase [candidate division KSB1 bacterium]|nr:M14 family metallopeptidase [candidate division KSB1 bacterium]
MKKIPPLSFCFFSFLSVLSFAQLPSPESQLGFQVGADRKLADWKEIISYFALLDKASDRLQMMEFGKSTGGRPLVLAVITSPQNFARLEDILNIQRRLADPRQVHPDSLASYLRRGRSVVMINCSIHSTEIAASQMAMELAYKLANAADATTQEILDNVILLLSPSSNPDGIQLVVDWYKKYLGTPYEGASPPWLYHPYAGHDDNRDWFMLNLAETKLITAALYHKWFPQILYDVHQMGDKGPRFFFPPFYEVSNPNIDPILLRSIMLIGGHVTTDLAANGFTGIATEWRFDTWWHGGMRSAPYYHNVVGLLSEAASCKLATPVEIKFEEIGGGGFGLLNAREFQTNFPEPWKGGWWRLRDIVDLELTASYSILTLAARYRDQWLHNFYRLGQRAIAKGRSDSPRSYVMPLQQHDPAAAQKSLDIMLLQGTEILRAKQSFVADGAHYPAGTFVIDLAQPYRNNIVTLFEKQKYPEKRRYPGGPLEQPYDVTGWTLPLQMGVQYFACSQEIRDLAADTLKNAFKLPAAQLSAGQFTLANVPSEKAEYFVVSPNSLDAYRLANRLLKNNQPVLWNRDRATEKNLAAGDLLIPAAQTSSEELMRAAENLNIDITNGTANANAWRLKQPRVGIYRSYAPTADEGWTRFVLDEFEFEYKTLEDGDVRRGDFVSQFDAIIFPDQTDSTILLGRRSDDDENKYPPEFTGGIGTVGLANVRHFVEQGGTLLALDSATRLFIRQWALPVVNELENVKASEFSAPGSLLRGIVDSNHPIAFGMPRETTLFFGNSAAFSVKDGKAIVKYPLQNPLLSGWLQGEAKIQGKAALVEVSLGRGRVILFGFRPQHRGQTYATFKLVFNSLWYAAAEDVNKGKSVIAEE